MKKKTIIKLGLSIVLINIDLYGQTVLDSGSINALSANNKLIFETKTTQLENISNGRLLTLRKSELNNGPFKSQMRSPNTISTIDLDFKDDKNSFFLNNRRNRYSSLWAFASLNYLYADLVGLMDKNILIQYQNGNVNGTKITPNFLTAAAGFMQIPLSNVFLPQVIKNERTLRWVQIASGTIMTLVQSGTLFVGKPSPYYILFSAIEIGTTAYITIDAIKWRPKKKNIIIE